jgi:hypothetical protein
MVVINQIDGAWEGSGAGFSGDHQVKPLADPPL